jgi:hypothetical protein
MLKHTINVGLALLAITASAQAELYDAAADFNGAQGGATGVWRYGSLDASGSNFTQGSFSDGLFNGASGALVGAS